jgi:hypothetical protein
LQSVFFFSNLICPVLCCIFLIFFPLKVIHSVFIILVIFLKLLPCQLVLTTSKLH